MFECEDDPAVFSCDTLPSDLRFMATVANGYIGTRIYSDIMHINGVYNGERGDCCRADVPSTVNIRLTVPDESTAKKTFTLNTRTGTFYSTTETKDFVVTQQIFAHRSQVHLMVLIITLERMAISKEQLTVEIKSMFVPHSQNIDFMRGPDFMQAMYIHGETLIPEVKGAARQSVHMISMPLPESLTLLSTEQSRSWIFLTAVADTEERAKECFVEGQTLVQSNQLYSSHVLAWATLWKQSCISLRGCRKLNQALHGCLYYVLSALPPMKPTDFQYIGLSPGGLSNGGNGEDYFGHIFWDQEIWLYPIVLAFYPELAAILLKNRIRTLPAAKSIAVQQGFLGAKYPWESAVTGFEVCNEDIYGLKEIHINSDISFAFQQYFYLTQDLVFFRDKGGWDVVCSIAEFWSSRVTWNPSEMCYEIKGVMPPDEYQSDVNNSAFTAVGAKYSLQFATELASHLQIAVPSEWMKIAEKIKVPFDPEKQYHPEFDGYKSGDVVKQADVVLLGYPLMYHMSPQVRKNDLVMYEAVTDPEGPAMTWSMFAIGWLELKNATQAQQQLNKCYSNIQEPFKVWSENADGSGAVNFLTGMGGFLQTVVFGYTGFRITKNCLLFDPIIPEDIDELQITGINYLGNILQLQLSKEQATIVLMRCCEVQHMPLEVVLRDSGRTFVLNRDQPVSFLLGPGKIQNRCNADSSELCTKL
ncbi:protein-glucosylgalactosylhydroxylysine glucosidase isoform X2 [Pristis pectinata]|nr:protein-glucosylgalactosylhydroxylysine glucosidase isoform X2 [Pristis pectinata]XP_051885326.1 protein-glucosylgalactosylhydroxylysine glucosidase isoform X2 [Pristis pectinata]XP_051885327.1 protein-glucosylgalactosylhydroxylysine glucosidase isoform X2 [Pristis pectinata]